MKLIFLIFLISFSAQAEIPTGVFTELMKFTTDQGQTLPTDYIQNFPIMVEQAVEARQKEMDSTNCRPMISVSLDHSITEEKDSVIRLFEDGLIRIEVVACLPKSDSQIVLSILADPVFRKNVISTIQETYQQKNGDFCEVTKAPTIGKSNYCFENQSYLSPNFSKVKSYNIWNSDQSKDYDSPVYYRGIFETATQKENQTVYHMISYIRSTKLTSLQKFFANGHIVSMQETILQRLEMSLR